MSSEKSVEKVCLHVSIAAELSTTENIVTPLGTFPQSRATVLPGPKISNVNFKKFEFFWSGHLRSPLDQRMRIVLCLWVFYFWFLSSATYTFYITLSVSLKIILCEIDRIMIRRFFLLFCHVFKIDVIHVGVNVFRWHHVIIDKNKRV